MQRIALTAVMVAVLAGVSAADQPVATVGGHPITRAELDKHVKARLVEIDNERYEALRDGLDDLITTELLKQEAKSRGITVDALQADLTAKVTEPTDAEIQKVYDENKAALKDATLDSVKPRIVDYLKQQKAAQIEQDYLEGLRKKYKVTVALQPPKIDVATGGRPELGPKTAPVTIIEFSDYECPFCKKAEESVQQVLKEYGTKVRFVYRDFPLDIHENARPAAQAAHCAQAQGKFWEMHAKLMAATDLSADALKKLADELKLDRAKFDECVAKEQFKAEIEKDIADGMDVGVSGTPAFFINGRTLSGAEPFEKFKEIIDEELARAKAGKPS
jgi:protein-disulfide isomerase